ncbi:MAG: hypothetical protein ACWGNK_01815 [Desulfobacterales bacterium]
MQNLPDLNQPPKPSSNRSLLKTVLLVVAIAAITSVLTVWLTARYLFPKEFTPVTLDAREEKALDAKIDQLDPIRPARPPSHDPVAGRSKGDRRPADTLEPEPYSEKGARREVAFTERELNALLATNTDLARKLAIDLSENLASAKLLVPLDPVMPFFGGKTLKLSAGLELRFAEGLPVVALKGISLWGVPIPNAWLGGIKNIDLVKQFGGQGGFWHAFAAGVEDIRVEEGRLTVRLRE